MINLCHRLQTPLSRPEKNLVFHLHLILMHKHWNQYNCIGSPPPRWQTPSPPLRTHPLVGQENLLKCQLLSLIGKLTLWSCQQVEISSDWPLHPCQGATSSSPSQLQGRVYTTTLLTIMDTFVAILGIRLYVNAKNTRVKWRLLNPENLVETWKTET